MTPASPAGAYAEAPPLVSVEAIEKTFREGSSETHVLRAASLELGRGESVSLVGASGSGKSTLLGVIAGLLTPDTGRVVFDGRSTTELDDTERARLRACRVGMVLQSGNLIPFLTAVENVELAMVLAAGDPRRARAHRLLAELGLEDRVHHLPRRLSGGEVQRVAVAVALANEPDLLLADEVTGELDATSSDQVMEIIFDAWRARGLTVLFVTHNTELAARAERRLQLVDGEVHPV